MVLINLLKHPNYLVIMLFQIILLLKIIDALLVLIFVPTFKMKVNNLFKIYKIKKK